MEFGSQAFFDRLYQGVSDGDVTIYEELDRVISRAAGGLVASKIPSADRNDVLQEVKLTVCKKITSFLRDSAENTPAQRNAWLVKIVQSKINDYYRKHFFRNTEDPTGDTPRWSPKEQSLEDYQADQHGTASSPEEVMLEKMRNKTIQDTCDNLMAHVCSLNLSPERIIAFFYNAVIFPLSAEKRRKKGDPTALLEALMGKELNQLSMQMKSDLSQLFGRKVPDWVFAPLDNKIEICPDKRFSMTQREITVVSSRTRSSLNKHRDKILGGDDNG